MVILLVSAAAAILGLLAARWWVAVAVVCVVAGHALWLVATGRETSEDSTAMLVELSAIYLYVPAIFGVSIGTFAGRSARKGAFGSSDRAQRR